MAALFPSLAAPHNCSALFGKDEANAAEFALAMDKLVNNGTHAQWLIDSIAPAADSETRSHAESPALWVDSSSLPTSSGSVFFAFPTEVDHAFAANLFWVSQRLYEEMKEAKKKKNNGPSRAPPSPGQSSAANTLRRKSCKRMEIPTHSTAPKETKSFVETFAFNLFQLVHALVERTGCWTNQFALGYRKPDGGDWPCEDWNALVSLSPNAVRSSAKEPPQKKRKTAAAAASPAVPPEAKKRAKPSASQDDAAESLRHRYLLSDKEVLIEVPPGATYEITAKKRLLHVQFYSAAADETEGGR
jgi:hypothetical protein